MFFFSSCFTLIIQLVLNFESIGLAQQKITGFALFFLLFLFVFFLFSIHTRLVCTHYTLQEKNNNSSHLIVGHNYNNSFAINHQTNGQ